MSRAVAIVAAAVICAALAATGGTERAERPPAPPRAAPRLSLRDVNRQDRLPAAERAGERRSRQATPLLAVLPLELGDVRIEITGIAGARVLLIASSRRRDRHYARALLRRALRALGDSGNAYAVRYETAADETEPSRSAPQEAAVAFCLAATNWSASTYSDARRRGARAATGALRVELHQALRHTQLVQLRADEVTRLAALRDVHGAPVTRRAANVFVKLDELQVDAGRRSSQVSTYRVRLLRAQGSWQVSAFGIARASAR